MVFYFTATGNSLYAARCLEENPISIPQALRKPGQVYEAESIGIVYPNYGGNVPPIVQDFLRKNTFHAAYFYMIATYGRNAGASVDSADDLCKACGIRLDYFRALLMVDIFLPNFDILEELRLDKNIDGQIAVIRADLAARKKEVLLSSPEEKEARKRHIAERRAKQAAERGGAPAPDLSHGKMFRITEACVGCGTCSRVCPEGDYVIKDGRAVHNGGFCQSCFACVHNCPAKAIRLVIPEKNPEARFRNPAVSLEDIIHSNCQTDAEG